MDQSDMKLAEQLREQLEGARATVDASRLQINAAREAGSRWQGRAELLQQELAELKGQVAKSQEEAARWQGRAQALQEALGEARQQVAWLSERVGVPKESPSDSQENRSG